MSSHGIMCLPVMIFRELSYIALLHVLIGPVARNRSVNKTSIVIFPAPGQVECTFYTQPEAHFLRRTFCMIKQGTDTNDIPECGIHTPGQVTIAHLLPIDRDIAGNLAMLALVCGNIVQCRIEALDQILVITRYCRQPRDHTISRPHTCVIININWRSNKTGWS